MALLEEQIGSELQQLASMSDSGDFVKGILLLNLKLKSCAQENDDLDKTMECYFNTDSGKEMRNFFKLHEEF